MVMIRSRNMKTKSIARTLAGFVLFFLGLAGIVYAAGTAAIRRTPYQELAMPDDFPVEQVKLSAAGQPDLAGWVSQGSGKCGVALLLHGRGSDKSHMSGRAKMLLDAGISAVIFDLPAHGESGGEVRGFGYDEATAVARMAAFVDERFPGQKVAGVGASLGAAALVLAQDRFKADAYVMEEMFTTLEETTAERMRLPFFRDWQAKLMLAQLPWRLGFSADDVRPVEKVGSIDSPILLMAGAEDPFAGPAYAKRLFEAVTAKKQLVIIKGARHQNLFRHDPAAYKAAVLPFLSNLLCEP